MSDDTADGSVGVQRRRESRREEWSMQTELAGLLAKHLDPGSTFVTALENRPRSRLGGMFAKRRGVRAGLPDTLVIFLDPQHGFAKPVLLELK